MLIDPGLHKNSSREKRGWLVAKVWETPLYAFAWCLTQSRLCRDLAQLSSVLEQAHPRTHFLRFFFCDVGLHQSICRLFLSIRILKFLWVCRFLLLEISQVLIVCGNVARPSSSTVIDRVTAWTLSLAQIVIHSGAKQLCVSIEWSYPITKMLAWKNKSSTHKNKVKKRNRCVTRQVIHIKSLEVVFG